MMAPENVKDAVVKAFQSKHWEFDLFRNAVRDFFSRHPRLNDPDRPVVHSLRSRVKSEDHLRDKLDRKWDPDNPIDEHNFTSRLTDLAGVRVLIIHQEQFRAIHSAINEKLESNDWVLFETPKAYTWDPESVAFFGNCGLEVQQKESFYTSIHFVVRPRADSPIACEIQVRTLFEEIWGEVDHAINYPHATNNVACKEQILVLAKLIGAGSRLVDAIFRSHNAS